MTSPQANGQNIQHVLVVWDQEDDVGTVNAAADFASTHGAKLTVFSCVERPSDMAILARIARSTERTIIDSLIRDRRTAIHASISDSMDADIEVVTGKAFVEIIRFVIQSDVDYVIKAVEPFRSGRSLFIASTDQHLVRKCPCPVWIRKASDAARPKTILAAIDVDEDDASEPETLHALNRAVVDAALASATDDDAKVHVLHAWEALGEGLVFAFSSSEDSRDTAALYVEEVKSARQKAMDTLLYDYAKHNGRTSIVPRLVRGAARDMIPAEAKALNADILVMGTVARTHLSGFIIGNTAEDLLNCAPTSVLTVKPPGFVSPLDQALR